MYVDADRPSPVAEQAAAAGVEVVALAPGVLARVADTVSPQPVVGVARRLDVALDDVRDASLIVVLVDVRDPGNLGTVVRSAEAAGGQAVICCEGSVDPFGPKAVRASAGSVFRMGLVDGGEPEEVLEHMGTWGVRRLGTQADGGQPYDRADLTARTAFVLGNEAHGLPAGLERHLDGTVTIPMAGRIESLNVAMAATVLCFEAARQRRLIEGQTARPTDGAAP